MPKRQENLDALREELAKLDQHRAELFLEIQQMKNAVLAEENLDYIKISSRSSEADKIHLFRNLFAGREDVFPVRFENR
ncbi:MAG TPA: hypothetical protein VJ904_05330 [Tichowtungia sp.]|nr:hypothetical protein [Tichowtungia sp.]